ncbi:MAG: hypothetical protein E6I11_15700 [Chloroflexi bacterium]|nr:MAG: hypothetical protein E6I30_11680 [Chloroflexota bacterium]TMF70118.1 MAG: hypothetical protein E6I17_04845 [Chloroflexota bacterium]TMF81854.1 MAG: hypothetical protein E6I11_15700 [Chloroflexota bacterium]TMG14185.1 MAG: hypothetical protein E6I00_00910 [Chloroflexota bacterium]TMG62605.1 MAG: hypothetical protein E6H83_01790 [Chloroflexota bacterium]
MNKAMRWRIISLQAIMVVVLAGAAAFAYGMGTFTTTQIHDELAAQQVYFPGTDQIRAGGALDPAKFSQEIRDQAGNQVTDGNQARIYANDFVGEHLKGVAGGLTYATVGTKVSQLNAQLANTPTDDPSYAALQKQITTLNAQRETLFKGETLRSMLLNAYGWWTIGVYTTYAAFALMIVALGVLGALVFEVFVAARRPERIKVAQKIAA